MDVLNFIAALDGSGGITNEALTVTPDPGVGLYPGTIARVMSDGQAASYPRGIAGVPAQPQNTPMPGVLVNPTYPSNAQVIDFRFKMPNGNWLLFAQSVNGGNKPTYATVVDTSGNFGTPTLFGSASGTTPLTFPICSTTVDRRIIPLDSTRFLVTYGESIDGGTNYTYKAVVLTISGLTVTVGPVSSLTSSLANSVTRVGDFGVAELVAGTKYMLGYLNTSHYAVAFSISGTTITVGTPLQVSATTGTYTGACGANTDKAVVVTAGSGYGFAIPVSASGLTLSIGTSASFGFPVSQLFMYKAANDKIIALAGSNPLYGVISLTGTVATFTTIGSLQSLSTPADIYLVNTTGTTLTFLTIGYGFTSVAYMRMYKIDYSAITGSLSTGVTSINSGNAAIQMSDVDVTNAKAYFVASVTSPYNVQSLISYTFNASTMVIAAEHASTFDNGVTSGIYSASQMPQAIEKVYGAYYGLILLNANTLMFMFINNFNSGSTYKRVYIKVNIPSWAASADGSESVLGVVQASGQVLLKGIGDGFTGLTPGSWYYFHPDTGEIKGYVSAGKPSSIPVAVTGFLFLGRAISTTQMHLSEYIF